MVLRRAGAVGLRLAYTRAADGHCSATFLHGHVLLCDQGRALCGQTSFDECYFVDAVTGAVLSRIAVDSPEVDTSGALMWSDSGRIAARSSPDSAGRVLLGVETLRYIRCFRYGVCVAGSASEWHVLRFDGEPAADAELDRKASVVARTVRLLTFVTPEGQMKTQYARDIREPPQFDIWSQRGCSRLRSR